MKKILTMLLMVLGAQVAMSQSVVKVVWATDFENGGSYPPCSDTANYRDTTYGPCIANTSCTQSHGNDWGISEFCPFNGLHIDTARVNARDTLWFSSCAFSTVADTFVTVEFQHICKVSLFDGGVVQVSNDSGATWHRLGANEYINTKGPRAPKWNYGGTAAQKYGVFNELSYAHIGEWEPGTDSVPKCDWWQYEYFNASAFLGGTNSSATCMIRFAAFDGPTTVGPENRYGWMLDSIRVKAAPCENIKPRALFRSPQILDGSLLYSLGPFSIYAQLWDENSGFCDAWLVYSVNGGPVDSVRMDTIPNTISPNTLQDDVWRGIIPRVYNGVDSFKGGDTICYWINAYDCSVPCRNQYHLPDDDPNVKCRTFYLTNGTKLPYCDNFDNPLQANFWDTVMVSGSIGWQLGNPTAGGGYGPISSPNTWTTVLAGNYSGNDEYYLESPIFDFTDAITPRISFWHRHQLPSSSTDQDRLRVEYSINNNAWQWLGSAFDNAGKLLNLPPTCPSTWYNETNGWSGQWTNNNQWRLAFYQLPGSFTGQSQVQFRFFFKADNNFQQGYGVSIDDWCIANPPKIDVSGLEHIRPFNDFIYKAGERDSSVAVKVRNIGTDTLMSIPVCYDVIPLDPNVPQAVQTFSTVISYPSPEYPSGLPPLAIDTALFNTTALSFQVPEGLYVIKAYICFTGGDADSTNDTTTTFGHFGFVSDTITHFTDFDTVPVRWTSTVVPPGQCGNPPPPTPTRWELGTPNFGITNSAYSAPNSWDINLDTGYSDQTFEILYTQIFDMTNADSAFLSFWHNRNTVLGEDGYYIDYSTNRGGTWSRLTAASQTVGRKINWTNSYPPLWGNFGAGWSGLTNSWEYSQCPVNNSIFSNKSEVMFRFVFRSNNTIHTDGVSIDDFRIVNPELYDAELFDIILPERGCVKDIAEPVEIVVKNVGKDTIDNIPVAYRYRYDATCTGTWGPWSAWRWDTIVTPILPGITGQHIFIDSIDMSVFGCYQFCAVVSHPLDNNNENDTLCGHEAENVRGCEIDLKVTTGSTVPDGEIIFQDSITLDTLFLQPMSGIGANVIQWQADVCLYDVGTYKFSITSTDTTMISWWRLRDPFADTTVATGLDPVVEYFFWECPPLLSAATEIIHPFGPSKLPIPQPFQIEVRTRNKGSIKLSYVTQTLEIKQTKPIQFAGQTILTHVDSIYFGYPGDPILFPRWTTVDTIWNAAPGEYEICSWTSLPNGNADSATFDDTACLVYTVLDTVSTLPYCNNFDNDSINPWASLSWNKYDTLSSFKLGTPNQSVISSAASSPNAWFTNLDADYGLLDTSAVYSPMFEVDTSCFQINFDHIFDTEHAFDGGTVEYSLDSGKTWRIVGGTYNPIDTAYPWSTGNWHNTPYVTGLRGAPQPPGWTGTASTGWRYSYRDFKVFDNGQSKIKIVFRFRFGADASINGEGWAFDNFCFQEGDTCIYYSCSDGVENGFETDVDCGGPDCIPCPSCTDGILNQNESEIDCGGVCEPCPSCVDNTRNGQETNIDCGGPDCDPCPSCTDGVLSANWVILPGPPPDTVKRWENGVDCGGPCPNPCWLGVDEINPNILFLGQSVPNPADDQTTLSYQIPDDGLVTIKMYSTIGVEVFNYVQERQQGIHRLTIDVSAWSQGIYYYTLEFNGEQLMDKIVVRRE
ncbi:MAG: T9SS type A sorting domain-containing protein [Vicingaceae bacterium]